MSKPRRTTAFRADWAVHRAAAAFGAAWWGMTAAAARRLSGAARKPASSPQALGADPPPANFVREAWREAFAKDAEAVARGLYPARGVAGGFVSALLASPDVVEDARKVEARRNRGGAVEAREVAAGGVYPAYYAQNFHFQSGGWFTAASARRYEPQVETLFAGAGGPMRRRALALLAEAWRNRDHRGLAVLDLACGAGGFLVDLRAAFPRARHFGLDLSPTYLAEAARQGGSKLLIQANAERLPLADASLDGICVIYLFHELPPKVRRLVAREIARVLTPGGLLAFADALQPADEPRLARLLEAFPTYFHEPFFNSYAGENLAELFGQAGLKVRGADHAFLTKALLFEKPKASPRRGKGQADRLPLAAP